MSKLIISDPQRLDDPEIAGKAKAEMMRFNAHSESNGRVSGKFETGISVAEIFAQFGNPNVGGPRQPLPNIRSLVADPSNPIQPDWNSAFAGGTLERIRGLIQLKRQSVTGLAFAPNSVSPSFARKSRTIGKPR